jgi:hypothetical protein
MWQQASSNGDQNKVKPQEVCCSNCKAPLYGYIVLPKNDEVHRINAKCPFCEDAAFEVRLAGKKIFTSTEYCHATPRGVYKPRASIADPLEYTDEINVQTEIRKQWRKK